jgi:hypothetical protein
MQVNLLIYDVFPSSACALQQVLSIGPTHLPENILSLSQEIAAADTVLMTLISRRYDSGYQSSTPI